MIPHLATLRALAATPPDAEQPGDPRNETSPLLSPAQRDIVSRLAAAALDLFEDRGFEATTIDDIARTAGLNRRTFFRYFPAKEDVLFARHVDYLYALDRRLELAGRPPLATARYALEALLDGETEDRAVSVRRHRLTARTLPLRDRETLWLSEYQRRVAEYLSRHLPTPAPPPAPAPATAAPPTPAPSTAAPPTPAPSTAAPPTPAPDALGPDMAAAALVAAVRGLLAEWAAATAAQQPSSAALRHRLATLTDALTPLLTGAPPAQAVQTPPAAQPAPVGQGAPAQARRAGQPGGRTTTLIAVFETTLPPAIAVDIISRSGITDTP